MSRQECMRCFKPRVLCICASVPRLQNRTGVHVLQHVRERGHPLGTERIVRLGLGAEVHVLFSEADDGGSAPVQLPDGAVLLYPSEGAQMLHAIDAPRDLVVLDGTWTQAHQLYRDNRWIRELPHVRLLPSAPSRYRIRREPRADYISTLEAVCEALGTVEPELVGLPDLLLAFDRMIDSHVAHRGLGTSKPRTRKARSGRSRAVPWGLLDHPESSVVVHVEPGDVHTPRPLLRISAVRVGDQATFDALVCGPVAPSQRLLDLAGVTSIDMEGAMSVDRALVGLATFCGPGGTVLPWRPHHLRWLRRHGAITQGWTPLSAVWHNVFGEAPPVTADRDELGLGGRAGRRLTLALQMVQTLRADRSDG